MEKPAKRRTLRDVLSAVADKRLYGIEFLVYSGPLLFVTFIIQVAIYIALKSLMLYLYVPLFIILVIFSAGWSKNISFGGEVASMRWSLLILFTSASIMATLAPFRLMEQVNSLLTLLQAFFLYGISTLALTIAIVEISVYGQRRSLCASTGLDGSFFKNQKKAWAERLKDFPNLDNIVNCMDGGKSVPELINKGSFSLALLWSWAIIEQMLDAIAESVISKDPAKREIFRHKNDFRKPTLEQLENLGFCPDMSKRENNERITLKDLYSARNDFAHRSIRPTFHQTFGMMATLKSFIEEMPNLL